MAKRGRGWHGEPERHRLARMGIRGVRPSKAQAVAQLKRLAMEQSYTGTVEVEDLYIFPLAKNKLWYDIGGKDHLKNPDLRAALDAWLYLPRERRRVNLDTLHSNQSVDTDHIEELIRSGNARLDYQSEYGDEIVVVRWRGENIIADGTHRLTAMKLLGRRDAEVEFLDLDKEHK